MVTKPQTMQRPHGRSERIRQQVHHAVIDLLREHGPDALTIPLIAERSGVHQATVYRRWATVPIVIDDIVQSGPARTSPLPDTGSLRGDVASYAAGVADTLAGPLGVLVLRAAMSNLRGRSPSSLLLERKPQLQQMLDRARTRGEHPPTVDELLELVIAPLYFHALFGQPLPATDLHRLLDRLHALHPQTQDHDSRV